MQNKSNKNSISIKKAAELACVSTATIKNWIKTNYLELNSLGEIDKITFDKFLSEVAGKQKLIQRANKLKKDYHDSQKLSQWLSQQLSSKETQLETIASEYEKKLSNSYKNKEGIYYTPDHIIDKMLEKIETDEKYTFLDPACGTGNFLIKALEKGIKPKNIYGFDTDINAIRIAKKRFFQKTGYHSDNIKNIDFLEFILNSKIEQKFDLIFTNPPWGKKLKKDEQLKYSQFLKLKDTSDTSSLFLMASLLLLKKNGYLGFLVQEAFFNIASFEETRHKLLDYNILRIIDFGKAFDGLMTKAQAIIICNNSKQKKIECQINNENHYIDKKVFRKNPKTIFNFWVKSSETKIIDTFFAKEHKSLKNNAIWGLGIVTGNNKKFCSGTPKKNYIPVFKGSDIFPDKLKAPSCFIPSDFSLYQQVAPFEHYNAKEKLIYRFISSKLIFFYDNKQRFILNSANFLIPSANLEITQKQLASLLNSRAINWLFQKIFNTHKILRSDLETLPIHTTFFEQYKIFDENKYLEFIGIKDLV